MTEEASNARVVEACLPLNAVGRTDIAWAGSKAANLGELIRAGTPVPDGFVVPTSHFREFMRGHGLDSTVREALGSIELQNTDELDRAASDIRRMIASLDLRDETAASILQAYADLGEGPVAVRSSATHEDLDDASFAGQQDTYLDIVGGCDLIRGVKDCWASLFQSRAVFYRGEFGIDHSDVEIAVVVQRMVSAEASGVMFTSDPSGDGDEIIIEAIWGLGEPLVSGALTPDAYWLGRGDLKVHRRQLTVQPWKMVTNANGSGPERVPVAADDQLLQIMRDEQAVELAELGLRLERHFGGGQDIEWAMADGELAVLQSRPITTDTQGKRPVANITNGATPLVIGAPASPGVAFGPIRAIRNATEIRLVADGDILVTEMTTPDFVPAMKRASAIVTDRGGRTCHAAIVSREMGLPCIVGAGDATTVLKGIPAGTVDGSSGAVYEGDHRAALAPTRWNAPIDAAATTETKLYVNLADPDAADRVASMGIDGVGLLRAEFMIALLGEHPRSMLESGRGDEFISHLVQGLERFAAAFHPRPVVYRFSDFKTNEYRNLGEARDLEPFEENPMIGYRGCTRYIAEPEVFALEVEALRRVRARYSNIGAMLPFVRTVQELEHVLALLSRGGLERGPEFKIWMMAEVPSNFLMLDRFLDAGIDGVSIGSNDLTQLVLGVDRDNERLADIFDERDPAVLKAIENVVRTCVARGATVSICGQGPSVYPEITRRLVEWGITSVSVTPDMIQQTRQILHEAEFSNAAR